MKGATRFLTHEEVKSKLALLLAELHQEACLRGLPLEALVDRSAYYFAEPNYIHPFREGNGRATREFMRQLYDLDGYEVLWNAVSTDRLLSAMEESVFDTDALKSVLSTCLTLKND